MTEVNAMPIDVFVRTGYLSEINRRILNPLGLHLMAQIDDNGAARSLGPIVDRRDDPEGFTTDDPAQIAAMNAAAARVREIEDERREWREQRTGWWVQPVPTDDPQPEREEAQAIGVGEIAKHLSAILRSSSASHEARAQAGDALLRYISSCAPAQKPAEESPQRKMVVPWPGDIKT